MSGFIGVLAISEPERGRFDISYSVIANQEHSEFGYQISESKYLRIKTLANPSSTREEHFKKVYSYVRGFSAIYANSTATLMLLGGIFRVSQGYAMAHYTRSYFVEMYPDWAPKPFFLIEFVMVIATTILANVITGLLSDNLERNYYFAKPGLCIAKAASGAISCVLIFMIHNDFIVALVGLGADYLLSKGWQPIAQAILRSVVDSHYQGMAMSLFIFTT